MEITVLSGEAHSLFQVLRKKYKVALFEFYFMTEYYLPRLRLLQPKCLVMNDSVDVAYFRAFSKYEVTGSQDDLHAAEEIKKNELSSYRDSDLVIAVTEEDAEILGRDCADFLIRVIPNIHTLNLSDEKPDEDRLIFIGGFSHDPNIDAVLYFCHEILPIIRAMMPSVKVDIVGSNPPPEIQALSNDPGLRITGYVPSTTPYLRKSCISIAPLRYGAGMKGKVGEAMAHGRPVVTTSVGAQGMNLAHRTNIMVSDSPDGFAEAVIELMRDKELYRTIQHNAIEHVGTHYTEEAVSGMIDRIVSELRTLSPKKMAFTEKASLVWSYVSNAVRGKRN
jgi:glycosyltransferase involved in cell wall biosynthesis